MKKYQAVVISIDGRMPSLFKYKQIFTDKQLEYGEIISVGNQRCQILFE